MEYFNGLSPFPVYDTEKVELFNDKLKEMKSNTKVDYDALPVIACKHCNSLAIVEDNHGNDICIDCASCNELTEFKDIQHYLDSNEDDVY